MSKRTERIVALERDAERHGRKSAALHWEAAALVVLELDSGKAPAKLAEEIGKSTSWVRQSAKASKRFGAQLLEDRPAWTTAFEGFADAAAERRRDRMGIPKDPAERVEVARKLLADPKVRRAVQAPSDREIDVSGRKDPVPSIETALSHPRIPLAESIATDLLDLADLIGEHGGRFSAEGKDAIRVALDRCSTELMAVSS